MLLHKGPRHVPALHPGNTVSMKPSPTDWEKCWKKAVIFKFLLDPLKWTSGSSGFPILTESFETLDNTLLVT